MPKWAQRAQGCVPLKYRSQKLAVCEEEDTWLSLRSKFPTWRVSGRLCLSEVNPLCRSLWSQNQELYVKRQKGTSKISLCIMIGFPLITYFRNLGASRPSTATKPDKVSKKKTWAFRPRVSKSPEKAEMSEKKTLSNVNFGGLSDLEPCRTFCDTLSWKAWQALFHWILFLFFGAFGPESL